MGILKCKMCGGELSYEEGATVCECEFCGSKQTIPTIDDEKIIKLYDRANRFRLANEFDKASGVYESIIEENDEEAEAYWGLLLCKYGIEYVDDPATSDKVPTCHRSSFDSIMDDSDFEKIMDYADAMSRNVYREQAKQIEEIRKGIIEVSGKEEPYDIFICYKETADDGDRTIDSVIAQDVYDALTDKGYRVFFSRISLEDKLGTEYEPYIFAALNSAKIMLAFGTNYDYYNAVWVKNEWSRYLKLMAKDKEKYLIPCYKDIDAYDMPKEFKHLQAQDMGKVGAIQDLLRGIEKILRPNNGYDDTLANVASTNADIHAVVASAMAANVGSNVNSLLERGFMTLEDGDFDKADGLFEDVLNQNPKCAEAYMGKLLVYDKAKNLNELCKHIFDTVFNDDKEVEIKSYDIKSIIQEKYFFGEQISDNVIDTIKDVFFITYETNIDSLQSFDCTKDYIEEFIAVKNERLIAGYIGDKNKLRSKTQLGDRYYARYKQYATDEIKSRFNINALLENVVSEELCKEKLRVNEIETKYSHQKMEELLDFANEKVKAIMGEEYERIETKYQDELKKWKEIENEKQYAYESECQNIKENWATLRVEIQEKWKAECERLKAEYNIKKIENDKNMAHVKENNNRVLDLFNQAQIEYENELRDLKTQIDNKRVKVSSLGVFKGKQKDELNSEIRALELKLNSMVPPEILTYGVILPMPPYLGQPILPNRPIDSEEPIYPKKPIHNNKPVREYIALDVSAVELFCGVLKENGFETDNIIHIYDEEQKRIENEKLVLKIKEKNIIVVKNTKDELILGFGVDMYTKQRLKWRILEVDNNDILLISEEVIGNYCYDFKENRDWVICSLRTFLNGSYLNNSFSYERNIIKKSRISYKFNNTIHYCDDWIFCLDEEEINKYMLDCNNKDEASWWLRSGKAFIEGKVKLPLSTKHRHGIKPALWISLE